MPVMARELPLLLPYVELPDVLNQTHAAEP